MQLQERPGKIFSHRLLQDFTYSPLILKVYQSLTSQDVRKIPGKMETKMISRTESEEFSLDRTIELKECGPGFPDAILVAFGMFTKANPIPAFLIDRDHRVVSWNAAMRKLTGLKSEDVIGSVRNWNDLYGIEGPCLADLLVDGRTEDLPRHCLPGCSLISHPDGILETTLSFPHRGPKGTWLHFTAMAVLSPDGSVIGAVETVEDITDKYLAERDAALTARKLKLMNDMAWHEIQNKITGMRGYVELSKDVIHDEIGTTCIEAEERILIKVHELLHSMREYQEIGSRPSRWINVKDTFKMIISLMETDGLSVNSDVDHLELFGDPALEKMFSHLIRFSLKNSKTAPEIRLRYIEKTGTLELIYEDNGTGIPLDKKSHLFHAAMVKYGEFSMTFIHDILEFSGMTIEERGDPGKGVCFVISVPKDRYRFSSNPPKIR